MAVCRWKILTNTTYQYLLVILSAQKTGSAELIIYFTEGFFLFYAKYSINLPNLEATGVA